MMSMRELHRLASFDGTQSGEDEDREHIYRHSRESLGGDSFYDRTPWFRLIGRLVVGPYRLHGVC